MLSKIVGDEFAKDSTLVRPFQMIAKIRGRFSPLSVQSFIGGAMTAEIAILNKTAVALASDSAVTIAGGGEQHKTFDSADKLFELSNVNPIGIMIYNGMSFAEAPLQTLVRQFRDECGNFNSVEAAANAFLKYLCAFGCNSPKTVQDRNILALAVELLDVLGKRLQRDIERRIVESKEPLDANETVRGTITKMLESIIGLYERVLARESDAEFIGGEMPNFLTVEFDLQKVISEQLPAATDEQRTRIEALIRLAFRKLPLSRRRTGLIIAGFGAKEIFPTLISYEIDGMFFGRLKVHRTNKVDIDREGPVASVLPFAQKEMVERFLYGLDGAIQDEITKFCRETVPSIRSKAFEHLEFDDESERAELEKAAGEAESAFLQGLKNDAFDRIRSNSQSEIEDMVEFMPKPELAKMAEALVNLTSMKRRVSRGMETVGGPVDVALISLTEGFVWVKRKHYFPSELNNRYLVRVSTAVERYHRESRDGEAAEPRIADRAGRAPAVRPRRKSRRTEAGGHRDEMADS